jgi:KDO2-lipid IV(A) lauroyltransferase
MYYVVYGLFWLISLLPLRVLYLLSDLTYVILYYFIKYRRDVVASNLEIVFPEKTPEEKKKIAKKYYRNLTDTFIETIKMISASEKTLKKRFTANWDVLVDLEATGRPIQVHLGHNFNWEWGNAVLPYYIHYKILAVYMPIANKIFERLFLYLRQRTGTKMIRATKMAEDFLPYRNTKYLLGLVADQNPGHPSNSIWFNFFGKPTPFVKGPAKNAILYNTSVVFAFIHKPRRGYYEGVFTVAEKSPAHLTEAELTGRFVKYLEGVIRQYPDMWLWSHRRWKWEWKEEYGEVLESKI